MERTSKALKNEKAILNEEISSLRDQVAEKDKELRGFKSEFREIQEENNRLSEKLTDVRAQKTKFSRLAREKAEEMGEGKREWEGGKERGKKDVDVRIQCFVSEEMLAKVDSMRKSNKEADRERRLVSRMYKNKNQTLTNPPYSLSNIHCMYIYMYKN